MKGDKSNMLGLNEYDDGELGNDDSDDDEEEIDGEDSSSSLDRKSIWVTSLSFIWCLIFFWGFKAIEGKGYKIERRK